MKTAIATTVVVGGGGWWGWRRGAFLTDKDEVYEPWETWKEGEKHLRLVNAAVLAASKHNTQPWRFRVDPPLLDVAFDVDRNVGSLDPFRQETYFSVGCAMANLLLAAEAEGFATKIRWFPDPELKNWIAQLNVEPVEGTSASDLYNAIPARHTNRGPYKLAIGVPGEAVDRMSLIAMQECLTAPVWLTQPADQQKFRALTVAATEQIISDQQQSEDNGLWYRTHWSDVEQSGDGLTLDALQMSSGRRLREKIFQAPTAATLDQQWLAATRDVQLATAPLFGILTVRDPNDPQQLVMAGIAWQKMHLRATLDGLAAQPLTQTIERMNLEKSRNLEPAIGGPLRELTGSAGEPVFAFRIGVPVGPGRTSPRRPVKSVLAKLETKRKQSRSA
ncbi:MAG: hypothetical protein WBX15_13515 [Thermoanaerobaculia bacterium]